jgi:hypothetical protein
MKASRVLELVSPRLLLPTLHPTATAPTVSATALLALAHLDSLPLQLVAIQPSVMIALMAFSAPPPAIVKSVDPDAPDAPTRPVPALNATRDSPTAIFNLRLVV